MHADRPMRRIRYQVATSLDGWIAGPNGEYDWIPEDADIDVYLEAFFATVDTLLIGRRTYDSMIASDSLAPFARKNLLVISQTLRQADHPAVTILGDGWQDAVAAMRDGPGKDIWLFGGGQLFRSALEANLVDTVELAVVPVLLGGGIPLNPPPVPRQRLRLTGHTAYEKSGIVMLEYEVVREPAGK